MGDHLPMTNPEARPQKGLQVGRDMIISLGLVSLALFLWMLFANPRTPQGVRSVDWFAVATGAAESLDYEVLAPSSTFPWTATSARIEEQPDGTAVWRAGFLTGDGKYVALLQRGVFSGNGARVSAKWVADETRSGRSVGEVRINNAPWQRLEGDPVPDDRRSLVLERDGVLTVVTGTASWDDLQKLAGVLRPVPAPVP